MHFFLSWSWISTTLTFNELFKSGILELDNKTENYPIETDVDENLFSLKIIRIWVSRQKEKKRKKRVTSTMTRRRIKSEFFCINSIQFIRLKIKKKFLSIKSPLYDIFMSMKCTVYEMAYPLNVLSLNILSMICFWNILLMKKIYLEIRFHVFICRF